MPNYCSNALTITGPNIESVLTAIKGDETFKEEVVIDDNDPLSALPYYKAHCKVLSKDGSTTTYINEHVVYLDAKKILPVPEGLSVEENHNWRVDHWGSKCVYPDRQSLERYLESATICFTTAWNPPYLLIQKLSAMFPSYKFTIKSSNPRPEKVTFENGHLTRYWAWSPTYKFDANGKRVQINKTEEI